MADPWRTVWILGSGFSKPLGGPTLPQLLSYAAFHDIGVRYADREWVQDVNHGVIRYLYHYGTRFAAGEILGGIPHGPGEPLWEHAEEFLDYLDTAALNEEGPTAWVLRKIVLERLSEAKANDVRMSDFGPRRGESWPPSARRSP